MSVPVLQSEAFRQRIPFEVDLRKAEGQGDGPPAMRFGGYCSSERRDRQDEIVLQKGLDFGPFIESGWYNEDHDQKLSGSGIVGIPLAENTVQWVEKGSPSPLDGTPVPRSGWFVLGDLLDTPEGRSIFQKSAALQRQCTHRRLSLSIEGMALKDPATKTVHKTLVQNIAITGKPVNPDAPIEVLMKALCGEGPLCAEERPDVAELLSKVLSRLDSLESAISKGMSAGSAINPPAGAHPGEGFAFRAEQVAGIQTLPVLQDPAQAAGDDELAKLAKAAEDELERTRASQRVGYDQVRALIADRFRLPAAAAAQLTDRVFSTARAA